MSTRIVTLFGEEIVPEPQKPAGKGRARKGEKNAAAEEVGSQPEPTTEEPQMPEATSDAPTETIELSEVIAAPALPEMITEPEPAQAETPVVMANDFSVTEPIDEPITRGPRKSRKRTGEDGMLAKPDADIIPEDWSGDKKYYTIGEVSGFFKVNTSHIRFWTNEFKLKVRTTRKGDRLYTPDQVKELRAIYHLVKERGFTLSGARTKLKEQNKRDVTTVDLKTSLQELRARLVILRDQLL